MNIQPIRKNSVAKYQIYTGPPKPNRVWFPGRPPWQTVSPNTDYVEKDTYVAGDLRVSQGNWAYQNLGHKPMGATGGDFLVVKKEYESSSPFGEATHFSGGSNAMDPACPHYFGALKAYTTGSISNGSTGFPGISVTNATTMDALGTKAIGLSAPTNPLFSAAAFLGELREGLPSAYGASQFEGRTRIARDAGDEYLNQQFGWLPLVSDLKKFSRSVRDTEKVLDHYEKMSGKPIKVHFQYPPTSSTTYKVLDSNASPQPDTIATIVDGVKKYGKLTVTKQVNKTQWFDGCFTYHLPPRGTAAGYLARANKLYGVRLTPEVVWQLTPWSWAADWFTNIGDITRNVSLFANDGLVLRYGYMMEKIVSINRYDLSGVEFYSYPGSYNFTEIFTTTVKQRRVANPYGFKANSWTGMSTRQKAIVAALGLSRSR